MLRQLTVLRFSRIASPLIRSPKNFISPAIGDSSLPFNPQFKIPYRHFIDFYKMGSKEAIEKEKARLCSDQENVNSVQIAMANKTLIPPLEAIKFPDLEVNMSEGGSLKLPVVSGESTSDTSENSAPFASLLCLSFRASSQAMVESWSVPFVDAFNGSAEVQVYEISFVDSWLLSLGPVWKMFIKMMRKSTTTRRQIVYSFGDHYDLRKKLQILNLLTGYIFLLDRFGRVRWQGFGLVTEEELSSLLSCTTLLLEDK